MEDPERASWLRSHALTLPLKVSRVFGIAPLVFEGNRAHISRALSLHGPVTICTINGLLFYNMFIKANQPSNLKSPKTIRFIRTFQTFTIMLTSIVATFLASARMKSWIKILKRVDMVKTKLGEFNYLEECKKQDTRLVLLVFVHFILLSIIDWSLRIGYVDHQDQMDFLFIHILHVYTYTVLHLAALQLILACRYISSMFSSFNKCLKKLLYTMDDGLRPDVTFQEGFNTITGNVIPRSVSVSRRSLNSIIDTIAVPPNTMSATESALLTLRELNTIYTEICDLVDIMNRSYNGITTLLIVTSFAIHLIISPCDAYNKLLLKPIPVVLFVLNVVWFLDQLIYICLLVEPGHHIIYETIQIKRTTSKIMGKALFCSEEFVGELTNLFTKLMLIKPTFSPLSVCTLSRRLTVSIIAAAMTYFVVVLQFQLSEMSGSKVNNTATGEQ